MKKPWILLAIGMLVCQAGLAQTISELEAVSTPQASTFELLEGLAVEVDVTFADGSRSFGTRDVAGDLDVVFNANHRSVQLRFSPLDGKIRVSHGSEKSSAELAAGLQTPSLAWAAVQARELATAPQKAGATELAWDGTLLRYRDAAAGEDTAQWPRQSWQDRLAAVTKMSLVFEDTRVDVERWPVGEKVNAAQARVHRPAFKAHLRDLAGEQIGELKWFPSARVIAWSLPGITDGWVDEQRLDQAFGFEPTMEWAAVQAFAFFRNASIYQPRSGTLSAFDKSGTDDGCTLLHWLDGSIFRPCCDRHDLCFEKTGCSWKSWFFLEGWKCVKCNAVVVACFATGGGTGGGGTGGGGSGGGSGGGGDDPGCGGAHANECGDDPCTTSGGSWCPPECDQCTPEWEF